MSQSNEALAFESAPDSDVYLVTGLLPAAAPGAEEGMAAGYVFAQSAQMAARAQLIACPQLRLTGVVSLQELKEQARLLESARRGEAPALAAGRYAQNLTEPGAKLGAS